MRYELEAYKQEKEEWIMWAAGSLEDVLSEMFYMQGHYGSEFPQLRITWESVA